MTLAILGYADRISVRPGDRLKIMVSCEAGAKHYRAELVRLICGDDRPDGAGYKEQPVAHPANRSYPGRRQELHPGSYVLVPPAPALDALTSFTLEVLIWPTTPGQAQQTLLSRWSEAGKAGYA